MIYLHARVIDYTGDVAFFDQDGRRMGAVCASYLIQKVGENSLAEILFEAEIPDEDGESYRLYIQDGVEKKLKTGVSRRVIGERIFLHKEVSSDGNVYFIDQFGVKVAGAIEVPYEQEDNELVAHKFIVPLVIVEDGIVNPVIYGQIL